MEKNKKLEKKKGLWFGWIIASSPILAGYWIPGINIIPIADIILIIAAIIMLWKNRTKMVRVGIPSLVFAVYVIIRQLLTFDYNFQNWSSTIHILLYYFLLSVVLRNTTEYEIRFEPMYYIAAASSIFIVIQTVVYRMTNYYISGLIPFLDHNEFMNVFETAMNAGNVMIFRARSFFTEPSTFATYVAIAMAVTLPKFGKEKKYTYLNILYTVGLLISLSTTGIVFCVGLWSFFLFEKIYVGKGKVNKKGLLIAVLIIIPVIIAIIIVLRTEWFLTVYNRTTGSALMNRIGNYARGVSEVQSFGEVLFGKGRITLDYYVPEIIYVYVYWGISGYVLLLWNIRELFKEKSVELRNLFVVCLGLFVIGGFMTTYTSPYIFYTILGVRKILSMGEKENEKGINSGV